MAEPIKNNPATDPANASTPYAPAVSTVGQTATPQGQATATATVPIPGQSATTPTTGISRTGTRDTALEQQNFQKMVASGQLAKDAKLSDQLTQEKVNIFTYGVGAPVFGAVDSSAATTADMNQKGEQINKDLAATQASLAAGQAALDTPEYKLYKDYTPDIEKARKAGEDLWARTEKNIKEDYRIRDLEQRQENRIMTGASTKQLARMNSLGRSGSAMNYLKQVDVQNQEKINKLLQQKELTLIAAAKAFQDGDTELLGKLINENTRVVDQINQVERWKFDDSIKTADQIMEQARFGWDAEARAMGKMAMMAESGVKISQISDTERAELEKTAGLPSGSFDAIYQSNLDEKQRLKDEETFKFLNQIPAGQTVKINGNYYTGLGTSGNKQHIVTDGTTNQQYVVTTDVNGKVLNRVNLGIKGKLNPSPYTNAQRAKIGGTIASSYADGTVGGQCGEFVHNFVPSYPYGLNSLEAKAAQVDPNIGLGDGQDVPEVGDVVIQDAESYYTDENGNRVKAGHVSVINHYDPKTGIMTLTESNFYGNETVSNTRTLNAADAAVLGFYRNNLNPRFTNTSVADDTAKPEEAKLDKDFAADLERKVNDLSNNKISWGAAYDSLSTTYKSLLEDKAAQLGYVDDESGAAWQQLLDQMLNKEKFYTATGKTSSSNLEP